jgi:hypothetical protein
MRRRAARVHAGRRDRATCAAADVAVGDAVETGRLAAVHWIARRFGTAACGDGGKAFKSRNLWLVRWAAFVDPGGLIGRPDNYDMIELCARAHAGHPRALVFCLVRCTRELGCAKMPCVPGVLEELFRRGMSLGSAIVALAAAGRALGPGAFDAPTERVFAVYRRGLRG